MPPEAFGSDDLPRHGAKKGIILGRGARAPVATFEEVQHRIGATFESEDGWQRLTAITAHSPPDPLGASRAEIRHHRPSGDRRYPFTNSVRARAFLGTG